MVEKSNKNINKAKKRKSELSPESVDGIVKENGHTPEIKQKKLEESEANIKQQNGKKCSLKSVKNNVEGKTVKQTASHPVFERQTLREYLVARNEAEESMIYMTDVQSLILCGSRGITSSEKPRWCNIIHRQHLLNVFLAVVDCASIKDFRDRPELFPFLSNTFQHKVEVVSPSQYFGCVEEELFQVSKCIESATRSRVADGCHFEFKINRRPESAPAILTNWHSESTSATRTLDLLLTTEEMLLEGYTLPVDTNLKAKKFVYSKKSYRTPDENSPLFAIDCEMVETPSGRELASICVVDENLECVYETLVKPHSQITNYNTRFSGITEEMLRNVKTRLADVQKHLQNILPEDAILVGQSFNFDLDSLRLFHPFIIDTSSIYNLSGYKDRKSKLQLLTKLFLKRDIQNKENVGHNPKEDAEAAMQLVILKMNKGYRYGNVLRGWTVDDLGAPEIQKRSPVISCDRQKNGEIFEGERRKLVFFRQKPHPVNVFQLVAEAGRTSTLIDLANCSATSANTKVNVVSTEADDLTRTRDSRALKECRSVVQSQESFLTVVQLTEVREAIEGDSSCSSNSCNKCHTRALKDTDRRLKKVFNVLPPKSLALVLFTGRTEASNATQNGVCFVGVKPAENL